VLLDRSRADVQFGGYFFIAAALDQEFQHLPIAAGDFNLLQIDHVWPLASQGEMCGLQFEKRRSTCFAKVSLPSTVGQVPVDTGTSGRGRNQ
jgi:hypothetical protein